MRHLWIVMLLIPASAAAQGAYVTGSIGQFRQDAYVFSGTGTAVSVAVGAFISPRVTIEGEAIHVLGFRPDASDGEIPYSVAGLIGFHSAPTGRVRPGVCIGLGVQRLESSRTSSRGDVIRSGRSEMTLVMGLEVPVFVTPAFAIVPDVRVIGALAYRDMALRPSLGVRWRF